MLPQLISKAFVCSALISIGFLPHLGCNQGLFSGENAKTQNRGSNQKENSQVHELGDAKKSNLNFLASLENMSFSDISDLQMNDYLSNLSTLMTNDLINIHGSEFSDLKELLDRHADVYSALSTSYQTLGEYFDSINIAGKEDISPEMVEKGYEKLALLQASGEIDKILSGGGSSTKGIDDSIDGTKQINTSQSPNNDDLRLHMFMALLVPNSRAMTSYLIDEQNGAPLPAQGAVGQEAAKDYFRDAPKDSSAGKMCDKNPKECKNGTLVSGERLADEG